MFIQCMYYIIREYCCLVSLHEVPSRGYGRGLLGHLRHGGVNQSGRVRDTPTGVTLTAAAAQMAERGKGRHDPLGRTGAQRTLDRTGCKIGGGVDS